MDEAIVSIEELPKKHNKAISFIIVLVSCACVILFGVQYKISSNDLMKYIVYAVLVDFVILLYLNLNQDKLLSKPYAWWLIVLGYMVSIFLLLPKSKVSEYPLWMIGSVMIAFFIDINMSFIITFGLLLLSIAMKGQALEFMIVQVIIGCVLCMLAKYLKKLSNLIYVSILISALTFTLLLIQKDFKLGQVFTLQTLLYIGSCIACIYVTFFINLLFRMIYKEEKYVLNNLEAFSLMKNVELDYERHSESSINNNQTSESLVTSNVLKNRSLAEQDNEQLFMIITNKSFPLLLRLAEEAPKLYQHSLLVANLSKKAANHIGVNGMLAYAGGWYHEIGRLSGKDYITCGVELAKEYQIPEMVQELIKQHNYKSEFPKSVEAAIVMLSDNIISTINYLKSTGQNGITKEKVIENTFHVRFQKGTLDESGLTLQIFNQLKYFYILEPIVTE